MINSTSIAHNSACLYDVPLVCTTHHWRVVQHTTDVLYDTPLTHCTTHHWRAVRHATDVLLDISILWFRIRSIGYQVIVFHEYSYRSDFIFSTSRTSTRRITQQRWVSVLKSLMGIAWLPTWWQRRGRAMGMNTTWGGWTWELAVSESYSFHFSVYLCVCRTESIRLGVWLSVCLSVCTTGYPKELEM